MLKTVRNAFKVEDIRKRLLYTLLMLVVVRFGSQLPTPGVDPNLTTTSISRPVMRSISLRHLRGDPLQECRCLL